jgi:hypothetical protein
MDTPALIDRDPAILARNRLGGAARHKLIGGGRGFQARSHWAAR